MFFRVLLLSLCLFNFTNIKGIADGCETGYACSIENLNNNTIQQKEKENIKKEPDLKNNSKEQEKKQQGIFVDGGKYNKPEYTETFWNFGLFP